MSETNRELTRLEGSHSGTFALLEELRKKLDPILRPELPSPKNVEEPREITDSRLARVVQDEAFRSQNINAQINDLICRIAL